MTSVPYVHGYSPREAVRLGDQAQTLADLLHGDERYPAGARVLEAGGGTAMMDAASWRQAIADLGVTAGPEGVFNYTFFKARAVKGT